jgi:hypothetical protein
MSSYKRRIGIDGQRGSERYVREIGVAYCDRINFNWVLIENNLARIYMKYCDISEFKNDKGENPSVNLPKRFVHVYKGSSVKK